jgi:adenylyltransferase/sulfurtransferase
LEEITVTELNDLIKNNSEIQIIDVREPHEYEIARIPNTKLIPLGEVVNRAKEIDSSRTAIIHCKGGVRSAKAINDLRQAGFTGKLINLKGGITAWSDEVDQSVPKY